MAALVCSDLRVQDVTIRSYTESMATGDAAVRFAQKLRQNDAGYEDFFRCFRAVSAGGGT